jgi:small basic protein (TIGR04137 family)
LIGEISFRAQSWENREWTFVEVPPAWELLLECEEFLPTCNHTVPKPNHSDPNRIEMTLDKSLKVRAGAIKSRNVMTRAERIKRLQDLDKWTDESIVLGMAKVRVPKISLKKKMVIHLWRVNFAPG